VGVFFSEHSVYYNMHVLGLTPNLPYSGLRMFSGLDWIEQCFTSLPTQYRLYGRQFLQVKRANQQCQSTEGTNSTQTNQTYNKQT